LSEPPRYTVFIEGAVNAEALAADLEQRLCEAMHYRYARELGQLGPITATVVREGERKFIDEQLKRGQRLGDVKPTGFDARPGWADIFIP